MEPTIDPGREAPAAFALALACARVDLRDEDRAAIERALARGVDWTALMELARAHGLRPLLQRHLGEDARLPRDVRVGLWAECEGVARRNRALAAELARIARRFSAAGVRMLPFKGPALALQAYGDLALREFGDLDILVARADVARARGLLAGLGYGEEPALQHDVEAALLASANQYQRLLRGRDSGIVAELHWKTDRDFARERPEDDTWWASLETTDIEGARVATLDAAAMLPMLCLHGSKHLWSSIGWLVDVAELSRRAPAPDWDAVAAEAKRMGWSRHLGLGLHLSQRVLGAALPTTAAAIARMPEVDRLADRIQAGWLRPACESGALTRLRLGLALLERPGHRVRLLGRVAFSPSLAEWVRWPLPRALHFLYPALRAGRLASRSLRGVGNRPNS